MVTPKAVATSAAVLLLAFRRSRSVVFIFVSLIWQLYAPSGCLFSRTDKRQAFLLCLGNQPFYAPLLNISLYRPKTDAERFRYVLDADHGADKQAASLDTETRTRTASKPRAIPAQASCAAFLLFCPVILRHIFPCHSRRLARSAAAVRYPRAFGQWAKSRI